MTKTSLIEFPCQFPVKIIGIHSPNFLEEIKQITKKHFPNFVDGDLTQKQSENNNYLALTINVLAQNQEMLDAYYQDITKNEHIKMVL